MWINFTHLRESVELCSFDQCNGQKVIYCGTVVEGVEACLFELRRPTQQRLPGRLHNKHKHSRNKNSHIHQESRLNFESAWIS